MKLGDMGRVVGNVRVELDKLHGVLTKRNSSLQGLDSKEAKEKHKESFISSEKIRLRAEAGATAREGFDLVENLLKDVVSEAPRWSRQSLMRRSRFAPKPGAIGEYASNREVRQLHSTMLEIEELLARDYWRKTLSQATTGEVLEIAREAATNENPALLYMTDKEFSSRAVENRPAEAQVEIAALLDAVDLPEEAEATAIFQQAERLGAEANHLFNDLVYNDLGAPKALRDDKIISQFLQQEQNP